MPKSNKELDMTSLMITKEPVLIEKPLCGVGCVCLKGIWKKGRSLETDLNM